MPICESCGEQDMKRGDYVCERCRLAEQEGRTPGYERLPVRVPDSEGPCWACGAPAETVIEFSQDRQRCTNPTCITNYRGPDQR